MTAPQRTTAINIQIGSLVRVRGIIKDIKSGAIIRDLSPILSYKSPTGSAMIASTAIAREYMIGIKPEAKNPSAL